MRASCIVLAALLTCACGAKPRAELALVTDYTDLAGDELDTYAFPRTFLDVTSADDGKDIQVTARQAAYEKFRVAVRRNDSFGVKTNLNLKKTDNSDILQEAGVEVTDNRVKMIEDLSKIAKTVVGLGVVPFEAGSSEGTELAELPYTLDTLRWLEDHQMKTKGSPQDSEQPATWPRVHDIGVWVGPLPPVSPMSSAAIAGTTNGIVYSACRELRLHFSQQMTNVKGGVLKSIAISDPRYFNKAAFPQKGKIVLGSQCGASVTREIDQNIARDTAVAESIMSQLAEIKAEIKKKKEEEPPEGGADPR